MSDDLVSRATIKAQMLRMGEPVAFGSDADVIDELVKALTEARAEIERLRRDKSAGFAFWRSIAKRFCNARKAALDRVLAAESEIERLTEQAIIKDHAIIEAAKLAKKLMTRALTAESELSTLRTRVREVVGPFAAWIEAVDVDPSVEFPDHASIELTHPGAEPPVRITGVDFRAARQLNEDLK